MTNDELLQALLYGLKDLDQGLQEAQAFIETDPRQSSMLALQSVVEFLKRIENFEERNLHFPLFKLLCVLDDLGRGKPAKFLRPLSFQNRHPDSVLLEWVKAYAIHSVNDLRRLNCGLKDACEHVAEILRSLGLKIGNHPIDSETVKNWRDRLSKIPERAMTKMVESLPVDDPNAACSDLEEAKKHIKQQLTWRVRALISGLE